MAAGGMAWLATTRLLTTSLVGALPHLVDGTGTVDDALSALASLLGLGMLLWLAVAFAVTALSLTLPAGTTVRTAAQRAQRVVAPDAARRVLALAVAAAIASSTTPARAATDAARSAALVAVATAGPAVGWPGTGMGAARPTPHVADGHQLDPSWAPIADRAVPDDRLDPSWGGPARRRPGVPADDLVVVRRGDTLWDLAAHRLGPGATAAEIARTWPLWFAANRSVIGPDPDQLTPGQRLRPPHRVSGGQQ